MERLWRPSRRNPSWDRRRTPHPRLLDPCSISRPSPEAELGSPLSLWRFVRLLHIARYCADGLPSLHLLTFNSSSTSGGERENVRRHRPSTAPSLLRASSYDLAAATYGGVAQILPTGRMRRRRSRFSSSDVTAARSPAGNDYRTPCISEFPKHPRHLFPAHLRALTGPRFAVNLDDLAGRENNKR